MNGWKVALCGCVAMMLCLWTACRSARQAAVAESPDGGGKREWVDKMAVTGLKEGTVTGKLGFKLYMGGKALSVGGNCNLKRGELIQLSLVALGFMEVGRLEFTPDYMMLINRAERQYVKVAYSEVPYLQQAGIDFYSLQALFWSDLFVPGRAGGTWQAEDFDMMRNEESTILTTRTNGLLQCQFVVDALTGLIRNTSVVVGGQVSVPRLNWTYRHFANVEQKSFPDEMQLSLTGGGKDLTAQFSLSSLKWNAKDVSPSKEPGGRYQKVSPDDILKKLVR